MDTKFLVTEHASLIRHLLERATTDDQLYYKSEIDALKLALGANVSGYKTEAPVGQALTAALELYYPGFFNGDAEDGGKAVGEISVVLAGMFLLLAKAHGRETSEKAQMILFKVIAQKMKELDARVSEKGLNPATSQSSH